MGIFMDKWKMDTKKRETFHIITPSHQERIFMMMRYILLTMVCIITSSCGYKPAKEEIPLFT